MNAGRILLLGLVAGGTFLAPTVALADEDEERSAYVALKGGLYFPTEDNPLVEVGQPPHKWPTQYEIDAALGVYWGVFGLQLSAGYFTTGVSSTDANVEFKAWPLLLILRLRWPLGPVALYAEGGAGVAFTSLSGSWTALTPVNVNTTKPRAEFLYGLGVDIYLGPFLLGTEARRFFITEENIGGASASNPTAPFRQLIFSGITVQIYVGYRW
jgi:hypothetical protein